MPEFDRFAGTVWKQDWSTDGPLTCAKGMPASDPRPTGVAHPATNGTHDSLVRHVFDNVVLSAGWQPILKLVLLMSVPLTAATLPAYTTLLPNSVRDQAARA